MDFNALQHKLFEMDPSDPAEDLRKLAAQANGGGADVPPTKDYVAESVDVPQGSMPLGIDSVADFAALAGIRIDEKQKMGSAGQAKGKDPMPSAEPGRTKHPLKDKLVGEADIDEGPYDSIQQGFSNYNTTDAFGGDPKKPAPNKTASNKSEPAQKLKGSMSGQQLGKMIGVSNPSMFAQAVNNVKSGKGVSLRTHDAALSEAFQKLMAMDPQETQRVMTAMKRIEADTAEAQQMPKPRDPNSKTMQGIRSSGAAGAHKDKKKVLPRKEKHKGNVSMESIKDQLWAALNKKSN